jgi:hypothetical protein
MPDDVVDGPLFVVSMWRSGSSLLYALLNQHPQIALAYEADLPLLTPVFLKPARLRDWPERWEFWNSALSRHRVELSSVDPRASFRAAFESVHKQYAHVRGAAVWGDKSPNYYDRMTWLARRFPGARFIVVWRDPANTARSMTRAAASGNSYFQKRGMRIRALLGYRTFRKQYLALQRSGIPAYALDYEDLTRDTETVMKGISEFVQVPFDPRTLTLENADRSSIYEGEHHSFVKGDKIVSRAERVEVLDAEWQEKIARYVRRWQRLDPGWPAHASGTLKIPSAGQLEPGITERVTDALTYKLWRFFDWLTAAIYSLAPLDMLRRYRQKGAPEST